MLERLSSPQLFTFTSTLKRVVYFQHLLFITTVKIVTDLDLQIKVWAHTTWIKNAFICRNSSYKEKLFGVTAEASKHDILDASAVSVLCTFSMRFSLYISWMSQDCHNNSTERWRKLNGGLQDKLHFIWAFLDGEGCASVSSSALSRRIKTGSHTTSRLQEKYSVWSHWGMWVKENYAHALSFMFTGLPGIESIFSTELSRSTLCSLVAMNSKTINVQLHWVKSIKSH